MLVELVLAEQTRVEGFVGQAARLGLPLQLSHCVAWLTPTHLADAEARAPRSAQPALELFALQLVEERDEMWHVAFVQDDLMLVSTEEHGAGDHQRRLREVATRVQAHAGALLGDDWAYTLGLPGLRRPRSEHRGAREAGGAPFCERRGRLSPAEPPTARGA